MPVRLKRAPSVACGDSSPASAGERHECELTDAKVNAGRGRTRKAPTCQIHTPLSPPPRLRGRSRAPFWNGRGGGGWLFLKPLTPALSPKGRGRCAVALFCLKARAVAACAKDRAEHAVEIG